MAASARILLLHKLFTAFRATWVHHGFACPGAHIGYIRVIRGLIFNKNLVVHDRMALAAQFRTDYRILSDSCRGEAGCRNASGDGILLDTKFRDIEAMHHVTRLDLDTHRAPGRYMQLSADHVGLGDVILLFAQIRERLVGIGKGPLKLLADDSDHGFVRLWRLDVGEHLVAVDSQDKDDHGGDSCPGNLKCSIAVLGRAVRVIAGLTPEADDRIDDPTFNDQKDNRRYTEHEVKQR